MLAPGDPIPDFRAADQSGEEKTFADLVGRKGAIIYFYPKDDTPGCTVEAQAFSANLTQFRRRGYGVVGVSKDSVASHCRFIDKHGLRLALLSDPDATMAKGFGVWVQKKNYGRTYWGAQRSTFVVNAEGVVLKVYPKVTVKGHAEAVLADLPGLALPTRYWLLKTEPNTYSWEDLLRDKKTEWDGVRNYQARNNLRKMRPGDRCLFYHSVKSRDVVGVCEVVSGPYPDPTDDSDRWTAVDVKPEFTLATPVNLTQIKEEPALRDMALVNNTRLSVQPVSAEAFAHIVSLGGRAGGKRKRR